MAVENRLPGDVGLGVIVGVIGAVVTFVVLSWLAWQIRYPFQIGNYASHLAGWIAMQAHEYFPFLLEQRARAYAAYLQQLSPDISPWVLTLRFQGSFLMASAFGLFMFYQLAKSQPSERHIAGR